MLTAEDKEDVDKPSIALLQYGPVQRRSPVQNPSTLPILDNFALNEQIRQELQPLARTPGATFITILS
jgi:hypothetical protein